MSKLYRTTDFLYEQDGKHYKVILYGAGKAGKDAYLSMNYCMPHISVLSVLDDNRKSIHSLNHLGSFVESFEKIYEYTFLDEPETDSGLKNADFIVIAAQTEETWLKMEENVIHAQRVTADKILAYKSPTPEQLLMPRLAGNDFLCYRVFMLLEYLYANGDACRNLVYDELKAWANIVKHSIIWLNYREWHANDDNTCAYLQMPKVASTSLTKTIRRIPDELLTSGRIVSDIEGPTRYYYELPKDFSGFKFTFVRNPFARTVSCYRNKIEGKEKSILRYYKVIGLEKDYGFDTYVRSISKIPDEWAERHFATQYFQAYKDGECIVDYIGRFEHLFEEYEVIRQRFGLESLEHRNASTKYDYRDYYTEELVELVHQRYKIDFEVFGYEKEYEELLRYVRTKNTHRGSA